MTIEISVPKHYDLSIPLEKSGIVEKSKSPDRLRIWCLASTEHTDEDDENIIQKSMDISYLTKDGKYLWGHSPQGRPPDPENVLGIIDVAKVEKSLYTEGELFKGKLKSEQLYSDFANNPDINPYRASIEGSYKIYYDPDTRAVQKSAICRNIAFDVNCINTYTMAGVLKADYPNHVCECHLAMRDVLKDNGGMKNLMKVFVLHNTICLNKPLPIVKALIMQWMTTT